MSDLTKTTDDQMYQMLFRAIHEHYLKPDTHLPEDELAKSFNVSRTRVRKILQRLIYEQLVCNYRIGVVLWRQWANRKLMKFLPPVKFWNLG